MPNVVHTVLFNKLSEKEKTKRPFISKWSQFMSLIKSNTWGLLETDYSVAPGKAGGVSWASA